MKLYKYIGFQSEHVLDPAKSNSLYFSTSDDLKKTNDPQEFAISWYSQSHFWRAYGSHPEKGYAEVFSQVRVLCLSKSLNKECWNEYCGRQGGVAYEFDYRSSNRDTRIDGESIRYTTTKLLNVPEAIAKRADWRKVILLGKTAPLNEGELRLLSPWVKSQLGNMFTGHINEVVLTKLDKFSYEDEFRFIYTPLGRNSDDSQLQNGKIKFADLGLSLSKVWTSNPEALLNFQVPARAISF